MWHEARRSEKKVHDMMDAARKRAQRRAIYLAKRRGDPQQSIQAIGSRCRIYRDDALYQATEDQQGMYDFFFSIQVILGLVSELTCWSSLLVNRENILNYEFELKKCTEFYY